MRKKDFKNLLDSKKGFARTGIKQILSSPDQSSVKGFKMENLSLKTLNMPGRKQIELKGLQDENQKLRDAVAEKERDLNSLKASLESLKKSSYEAGYKEGAERGRAEGERAEKEIYDKSLEDIKKNTAEMLKTFSQEKSDLFLGFEQEAVKLLSACVQKLFGNIITFEEMAILPIVKTAIDAMTNNLSITIKVNPEDYQTVNQEQEFWLPMDKNIENIKIDQNSRIEKCSCVIESETTSIEMKLPEIIKKFDDTLKSVFEQKAESRKILDSEPESQENGENDK